MMTWTLTTTTPDTAASLTAAGGELTRTAAVGAAVDATRSALMDARTLVGRNGIGPTYWLSIDHEPTFVIGVGGTSGGDLPLDDVLDQLEDFENKQQHVEQPTQH